MIQAYKKYWKGYVDFSGTTSRKDYWLAVLASIIVTIILEIVGILIAQGQTNTGSNMSVLSTLIMLYSLATFLPSLAIMVRRLRDAGQKWANIFWMFLPFAGIIILIVKLCKPSEEGTEYSAIPTQFTTGAPVYRTYQQTSGSAPVQAQTECVAEAKTSFCHKCGAPIADNAKFCAKCGTKRFEPADFARTSYVKNVSNSDEIATAEIEAKPLHSVWTGVGLIIMSVIIFLLHCIPGMKLLYCASVSSKIAAGLLGIGVYLLMQKDTKWKIAAVGSMVVSVLLSSLGDKVSIMNQQFYGRLSLGKLFEFLFLRRVHTNFVWYLFEAIFAAGGALLFGWLLRDKTHKTRIWHTSLYTALLVLLLNIIHTFTSLRGGHPAIYTIVMLSDVLLFNSVLLYLAPPALNALCAMRTRSIRLSGWGRVWCWLCAAGMIGAIILCVVNAVDFLSPLYSSQLIMSVAALTGFIMLLAGKRLGWYVVLFSTFTVLIGQFSASFTAVIQGVRNFIPLLSGALLGAINPVITWLSIRNAWQADISKSPVDSKKYVTAVQMGKMQEQTVSAAAAVSVSQGNTEQQKSSSGDFGGIQHYMKLADKYAHIESLFAENPEKKTLEEELLSGGAEAQAAITAFLKRCGTGNVQYGWWNGAASLTAMLRKIGGKNAEADLRSLKTLSTNIWEYHTQIINTAEKELLELAKENGSVGSGGLISPEYAHAELLRLQNVNPPEKRLEEFFALQESADSWPDKEKAFYYFIAGGAARVLYPVNKSNLAFYAAQVFCDPDPSSMGWQHLRETEGTSLPATIESAKRMCEKYPLPKSIEEAKNYSYGFEEEKDQLKANPSAYTLDTGLNDLIALFRTYPQLNRSEIQKVGQKIYDASIPLVSGVGGMHQLYARFKERMPMYGAELSRIWDGIGDWAD